MKLFLSLMMLCLIVGCSALEGSKVENEYPVLSPDKARRLKYGKMTGSGIRLFSLGDKGGNNSGSTGVGVNSFLWRGSLDTLSFIPLSSVDPHGGVIITDWYEDPSARGEKFKINVIIMGTKLRSDGVRVSVFKKTKNKLGEWEDAAVSAKTSRELEDKILTRARELKISNTEEK